MKNVLLIASLILTLTTGLSAQKIAYVNSQEILTTLPDYKVAQDEVQRKGKELQEELAQMQTVYQTRVQEFQKEEANLPDAIKQTRYADIADLENRIRERQAKAQEELQILEGRLLESIVTKLKAMISTIAKEQGFTYVLDANSLLYVDTASAKDLSPDVKAKLIK